MTWCGKGSRVDRNMPAARRLTRVIAVSISAGIFFLLYLPPPAAARWCELENHDSLGARWLASLWLARLVRFSARLLAGRPSLFKIGASLG